MEYTVDVKEDGIYSFDAEVASNITGGAFHLTEYGLDHVTFYADIVEVPKTGGSNKFQTMHCVMTKPLTAGRHILCLNIDKGGFYIKNLTFKRYEQDKNILVSVSSMSPTTIAVGDTTVIKVTASNSGSTIDNVKVFANDLLIGTLTQAPYSLEFSPSTKGTYYITAIATNAEGKENTSAKKTLKVNGKRTPYNSGKPITIPGIIQAENFDMGGEGLTFHDSDSNREGDVNYRSDGEGVDFVKGNGGTAIGYTAANEWLEYTVNITEGGKYSCVSTVSSGVSGSAFNLQLVENGSIATLCRVTVPKTGDNNWDTYRTVTTGISRHLDAGEHILRITIAAAQCNIDKIELKCIESDGIEQVQSDQPTVGRTAVYNLAGQRVANGQEKLRNGELPKGIYIVNGRKVMVR